MPWKYLPVAVIAVLIGIGGYAAWVLVRTVDPPPGFAKSNGRLEAERVDIATKYPGRIKEVLVKEGDQVSEGQILARMDTSEVEAQLREATAAIVQSERQLDQAIALLAQRSSELALATRELERSTKLAEKGFSPEELVDQRRAAKQTAEAGVKTADAGIERAKAAIVQAHAGAERLKAILDDSVLKAPRAGRVQYLLARAGEVLGAGGKVLTLLDLTDVYMIIFLPTKYAGPLELGSEARIIPDAAPQYVVPASVSFVASDAQFTPKYVETKSEREKLMFRIKVRIREDILKRYARRVKTGVTGVAYVKVLPDAQWPEYLRVNLPKIEESKK